MQTARCFILVLAGNGPREVAQIVPCIAATNHERGAAEALWLGAGATDDGGNPRAGLLASVCVPVLFGEGWAFISGTVSILCLLAIPTIPWSGSAQWCRAENRGGVEGRAACVIAGAIALSTRALALFWVEASDRGSVVATAIVRVAASLPFPVNHALEGA